MLHFKTNVIFVQTSETDRYTSDCYCHLSVIVPLIYIEMSENMTGRITLKKYRVNLNKKSFYNILFIVICSTIVTRNSINIMRINAWYFVISRIIEQPYFIAHCHCIQKYRFQGIYVSVFKHVVYGSLRHFLAFLDFSIIRKIPIFHAETTRRSLVSLANESLWYKQKFIRLTPLLLIRMKLTVPLSGTHRFLSIIYFYGAIMFCYVSSNHTKRIFVRTKHKRNMTEIRYRMSWSRNIPFISLARPPDKPPW